MSGTVGCYGGVSLGDAASAGQGGASAGVPTGGGADDGGESGSVPIDPETEERVGVSGLRRLTATEYDATVRDLLGVEVDGQLLLPTDWRTPYDNDYTTQFPSQALIEGAELLAADVAELALATPERRLNLVGCEPASETDEACFRSFVTNFGRRAFRRPLTETEIDRFAGLLSEAQESGDFYAGVQLALRTFLQHPAFLYRLEIGVPVEGEPDLFALTDYEIATRLSYFLWGTTPSDELLDLADAGELGSSEDIRSAAADMLADERAQARVSRFHALWLGYESLSHQPDLNEAMQAESHALIKRMLFDEGQPWQEIMRAGSTFINETLAAHYGLPVPAGGEGWVDYGDTGRRGLLSHGSFLSSAANVGDSSPTKRGVLIRTRLMCQDIPPPPPEVNVDDVNIPESSCKEDFYRTQHAQGGCAGCHALMDPVGLGLENYDHQGKFRTVEFNNPSCVISGEGDLDGKPFSGPAELADLMLESGAVNRCVASQLYRLSMGRYDLDGVDKAFIDMVVDDIGASGDFDFFDLVGAVVGDDAFRYRRLDPTVHTVDPDAEEGK